MQYILTQEEYGNMIPYSKHAEIRNSLLDCMEVEKEGIKKKAIEAACLVCNSCDHCLRDKSAPFECDELKEFRKTINEQIKNEKQTLYNYVQLLCREWPKLWSREYCMKDTQTDDRMYYCDECKVNAVKQI